MENNEVKEVREYTDQDILKAVGKLPEDYQDILLTNLTVYNIKNIVNSKKDYEDFYSDYIYKAYCCSMLAGAMKELYDTIDSKLEDDAKYFSADYEKLSDFEKRYITVNLMNNKEFQKNCCDVLEYNFNKIINSDETLSGLSKAFGLNKIFKKFFDMNRKNTCRYEVSD